MEDGYSRQKQKLAPPGAETHERYILLTPESSNVVLT